MSDSNEARDYLLGRLPPLEAEDFEERFFTTDHALHTLAEEQEALIDSYVAGDLSAEDEVIFRAQVERSSTLKNKVELHRRLVRALERQSPVLLETRHVIPRRLLWLAVASLGIATATGIFFLQRSRPTPAQVATIAQPSPAPPRQDPDPTPVDAVFFLSAKVTRGANSLPVLKMPTSAKLIEVQVELPVSAENIQQWEIEDVDGRMPKLATVSATQTAGGTFYVVVRMPAEDLVDGIHSIRLKATPNGTHVIRRDFRVHRI